MDAQQQLTELARQIQAQDDAIAMLQERVIRAISQPPKEPPQPIVITPPNPTEGMRELISATLRNILCGDEMEQLIAEIVSRSIDKKFSPLKIEDGLIPIRSLGPALFRAKNCKSSKPCGASCISSAKACLIDLSSDQRKLAEKARRAMKKGEVGPAVDLPANEAASKLETEIADLETQKTQLQTQVNEGLTPEEKAQIESLENERDELMERFSEVNSEISDKKRELRDVKGRTKEARDKRKELREQISDLEAEESRTFDENSRLADEISRLQDKPARIEAELNKVNSQIEFKKAELLAENGDPSALEELKKTSLSRPKNAGIIGQNDTEYGVEIERVDKLSQKALDRFGDDDPNPLRSALSDIEGSRGHASSYVDAETGKRVNVEYSLAATSRVPVEVNASTASASSIEFLERNWNGDVMDVSFYVNGSFRGGVSDGSKVKAALTARTIWRDNIIGNIPPGTLVENSPIGGRGGHRDRIYQNMGFGRVHGSGSQFGIVGDQGQLIPIEFEEIEHYGRTSR